MIEIDWDKRAELYGRRAVMDLALSPGEVDALTQLQEEIILHRLDRALEYNYRGMGMDFGCGVGRFTKHLAARCERLLCYDPSSKLITIAREDHEGLDPIKVHFTYLPPEVIYREGGFRWIWITLVLGNISDFEIQSVASRLSRLVDMGGVILFAEHIHETDRGSDFWRFRRVVDYLELFPGMKTRMVDQYVTRGNTVGVFEARKQ